MIMGSLCPRSERSTIKAPTSLLLSAIVALVYIGPSMREQVQYRMFFLSSMQSFSEVRRDPSLFQ